MNILTEKETKSKRAERIIELYISGSPIREIMSEFNVSRGLVDRVLKKGNIQTRSRRDYTLFDTTFFDKIDSQEKAYALGFLYADGCNRKTDISLVLQDKDFNHLKEISKLFKFKGNFYHTNHSTTGFSLSSRDFCNKCSKLGMTPAKSLTLTFPNESIVPKELQRHFIRGYFDGDGCLYVSKATQCTILGTESFLSTMNSIINEELGFSKELEYHPNGITRRYRISQRKQIKSLMGWLYQDATIYLDRKYQKYLLVI